MMPLKEWETINSRDKVDIYCAGVYGNNACYWKNGVRYELEGNTVQSSASKIFFINNNIYNVGYIGTWPNRRACYLKNGNKITIDTAANSYVYDIKVYPKR